MNAHFLISLPQLGLWIGDSDVACQILKKTMSNVIVPRKIALSLVTYQKYPCRTTLKSLSHMLPVEFKKKTCCMSLRWQCRMSKEKKTATVSTIKHGHVMLSILGVWTCSIIPFILTRWHACRLVLQFTNFCWN